MTNDLWHDIQACGRACVPPRRAATLTLARPTLGTFALTVALTLTGEVVRRWPTT